MKVSEYYELLWFVILLVMVAVVISFKFYNVTTLLHYKFRNYWWGLLDNDSCSKFWNLSLNSCGTNISNGGTPPLSKVTTSVNASNFKNETAEI